MFELTEKFIQPQTYCFVEESKESVKSVCGVMHNVNTMSRYNHLVQVARAAV
jgi:hypothetical protein